MNKSELIEHIADRSALSKAGAARALNSIVEAITQNLKKGDSVAISGFGTFAVRKRSARVGRNPKTGETAMIKPAKVPHFRAGKNLKENLN